MAINEKSIFGSWQSKRRRMDGAVNVARIRSWLYQRKIPSGRVYGLTRSVSSGVPNFELRRFFRDTSADKVVFAARVQRWRSLVKLHRAGEKSRSRSGDLAKCLLELPSKSCILYGREKPNKADPQKQSKFARAALLRRTRIRLGSRQVNILEKKSSTKM